MQSHGEVGQAAAQEIVEPSVQRLAAHCRQGRVEEGVDEHRTCARHAEPAALQVEQLLLVDWPVRGSVTTADHLVLEHLQFRNRIRLGMV